MANRVTTIFDAVDRGLSDVVTRIKTKMNDAETASGKLKAGWAGVVSEFQNSREAQVAAAGAALFVIKESVQAASNLEESINAVNVAYGEQADGVHALGEASAETFGLSQRAFNEFAVQFSAFATQIANESGRDVVDVLEEMTTRTADFASVNNLDMAEAGRVMMSSLAGETEALRRYGGDVSAASVKTFAYATGVAEAGSELTQQQRVLATYGLLMQQTNRTAGDFENTSGGLANQQRILTAQIEDASAALGSLLIPEITDAINTSTSLTTAANELGDAMPDAFGKAIGAVRNFIDPLYAAKNAIGGVSDAVKTAKIEGDAFADTQAGVTAALGDAVVVSDGYNESLDLQAQYQEVGAAKAAAHEQALADEKAQIERNVATTQRLTDEYNEQQDSIDDLIGRKAALVGGDIAVRQAQRDARTAAAELNIALEDQSLTLNELAPIIDNATQAQLDAAQAAADRRAAELEANGTLVDSKVRNQLLKEELSTLASTVDGPLRQAILRYIDDLNRIPSSVNTNITQNGTDDRRFGAQSVTPGTPLGGSKETGVIVAAQSFGGGGGFSPTINVYAGIGTDGRQVGRQIVEALEAFLRSGGQLPPTMTQRLGG